LEPGGFVSSGDGVKAMGYRKPSNECQDWKRWLENHRTDLLNAGLPDFLWESKLRWLSFIEEGYDHETGWKPELLLPEQRKSLRDFVEREYSHNSGRFRLF
jgi:hypothetical protein